ncbi:MAG: Protein of unknown function (DUF1553)/Protein of unknown function, partial [Verrucomicrobiales bacterium]|nr:Protein of unknown function (DUF1553)/Protein of unknown function [Verrucomicrobiales bacterium]
NLTGTAWFSSGEREIASVSPDGIVRGLKPGKAVITARIASRRLSMAVTVTPAPAEKPLSFVNDVLPVMSKAGCNAGSCHAKPDGQNGFKLSVFAYDPKSDYSQIVKGDRGRRIFPSAPEESLILKKPTLAIDHEGGQRFEPGSESYNTILAWIKQGMPFRQTNDASLVEIKVYPHERRYQKSGIQPLLVQARYSDGSLKDVTGLSDFVSNDKEIAKVDEHGIVQVGTASGEGVVIARFMGMVDFTRVTVPADKILPDAVYTSLPVNNPIDKLVYTRLKTLGFSPSDDCTDAEFIRRASLDAIGTLRKPSEVREFLADQSPDKRTKLIDRLLTDPAFGDYWAIKWGDLIRPNPTRVGVKPVYLLDLWLRDSFRANKPYDQLVRELLTSEGSTHQYGPIAIFRDKREPVDATAFVSQIFLGVRMECAKCHHHPNEKWSQTDYFQFAAFFGNLKHKGQGISPPISGEAEFIWNGPGGEVRHPVSNEVMKPKPPDGPAPELLTGDDPRAALADWMTRPDNPFFARAIVNRIWSQYFGRGIVEPVDDFRASNPPTNEPLLDWLAHDFVQNGYDLKHLMRTIMQSHVYQLSSTPNQQNISDTKNFSRAYRRRLPAEVLLDAVSDVTGASETFQGLPAGARALQTWNHKLESEFMDAFGRPNSSAECPCERDTKTSAVQALHLMNSNQLQAKIDKPDGRARKLAESKESEPDIINDLYIATLNRMPTADETTTAEKAFTAPEATRKTAVEDLMWALINSAEFVFNH